MKNYLSVKGVSKRFDRNRVLDDVTFELDRPGVTVLLGPNGAGKSTLLSSVLGLVRPDRGEIRVLDGLDPVRDRRAVCQAIAYVPDRPDAPGWMTPTELFRFLEPQYPGWNAERAARMGERLELPLHRPLRSLSRGEGAKAMLVAAFATGARLVLLDEPFGGLDPVARKELLRAFLEEFRCDGSAALIATHDLEIAARIADRVILLAGGRIRADGEVEETLEGESSGRVPERLAAAMAKVA